LRSKLNKNIPFLNLGAMNAEASQSVAEAWRAVTAESSFIGGRHVQDFESQWASYCGSRFCVGVSDGTAALELVLRALDVGPGDDILVPANTFIATWEAVAAVGANPVAVDVDPESLLVTAETLGNALTKNTVGAIPVHLFGRPANMTEIMAFAGRHKLWIVEDAAQAHGAKWNGQMVGTFGDAGCFSFYPGKNLGAFGDAGAVITNSQRIAQVVRSFANHGRRDGHADVHDIIGNNRRLDALQAAILSAKLPFLNSWNARRRNVHSWYAERLGGLLVGNTPEPRAVSVHHLEVIRICNRDQIRGQLTELGIGTGIHYRIPCHRHVAFANLEISKVPVVELAANEILSLPMYPHMLREEVEDVSEALLKLNKAFSKSENRMLGHAAA
jgi:dTDP-4-amino-4,6-dideoxygalactose transaminase